MRRSLCVLSLLVACVVCALAATGPSTAQAAPSGFTDEVVADLSTLTAVEGLPDGRVVVLEQSGRMLRIDDRGPTTEVVTLARFDVCSSSERGLLGFAVDPAFVTSGFVYVFRTVRASAPGGCVNRVSRFRMGEGGLDESSERVLIDGISSVNGNHNGGDLAVGNDGYLYVTTGDAGRDPRGDSGSAGSNDAAQDLSLLNGKILRVERATGVAPASNPYTGPGTADCRLRGNTAATPRTTCREIFASGLRNPYRFAFDPDTSATRFFVDDVGQGTREEVDEGAPGANYGWPSREGRCPQGQNPPCAGPPAGITDPIADYGHDVGRYVTGGAFVPDGMWPEGYDGDYLVADGASGALRRLSGQRDIGTAPVLLTASGPTDLTFVTGPGGAELWYVQQDGRVHVVRPPAVAPAEVGPQRYVASPTPQRRFDSRATNPAAPLRAGRTRLVDLGAPAGATSALINLTLVRPLSDSGFATAWQPRTARPATSNVNAPPADNVSNATVVPLDERGRALIFTQATSHVVIDVAGFHVPAPAPTAAGRFVATGPERLVDTRLAPGDGNEHARRPDGPGERISIPVGGRVGTPSGAGEVDAVAVVVTAINGSSRTPGFATVLAGGAARPVVSNVNVNAAPDVRANLAVVPVGGGSIDVYVEGIDEVVVDVVGHVTGSASAVATAGRFHPIAPRRVVDTRDGLGFGRLAADRPASLDPSGVPASASAVAQNLTLARTSGRGYVTAFPGGERPTVSNVNASGPGQIRAALGITRLGGGTESLVAGEMSTDLAVDVLGWYE